jgi:lysophospholipase L1-like esterase
MGGTESERTFAFAFKNLKGATGSAGKTPVKGEDYFTSEDKAAFIQELGILEEVSYSTVTANLNTEVYEYGYLTSNGENHNSFSPISTTFRNPDYIPVEGGKKLLFNSNFGSKGGIVIVQYDVNKQVVVNRTEISSSINKWDSGSKGITLNASTRYVRIAMYNSVSDLSTVKLALFYSENIAQFFSGAGDVFNYIPHLNTEVMGEFIPLAKIQSPLTGKKIVYDGDSIAESRTGSSANNGGSYAKLIADRVGGTYVNHAAGGARLTTKPSDKTYHSVVDNLPNLPKDGDLYCFEGGINDYWTPKALGTFSKTDFTGTLDTNTICGALETIFRYALTNFVGKPICFVITHKIQSTAYVKNTNGDTFEDYRNAMVGICNKYSIPYYDAFSESGLNGWNTAQNNAYLISNTNGTADGCHPNEDGYKRYYVPQLIQLFERIMPVE